MKTSKTVSKTTIPKPVMAKPKVTWTKPGVKSTEFWGAIAITILQISKVAALPSWAAPVAWGLYTLARGLAKSGGPEITE